MNIWLLPDGHLGHKMIVGKGYRKKGFEWEIIKEISRCVQKEDVLVLLGDVSITNTDDERMWHKMIRMNCKGKLWLTLGNHDRRTITWYMREGYDFVADSIRITQFTKDILLSHKPTSSDADLNIHGHLHNTGHRSNYEQIEGYHKLLEIESKIKLFKLEDVVKK